MSKHRSHRGVTIDMDAMRAQNEGVIAGGNMGVNARGDKVDSNGRVVEPVQKKAKNSRRKVSKVKKNASLKPSQEAEVAKEINEEVVKKTAKRAPAKKTISKDKEQIQDDGSIVIDGGDTSED